MESETYTYKIYQSIEDIEIEMFKEINIDSIAEVNEILNKLYCSSLNKDHNDYYITIGKINEITILKTNIGYEKYLLVNNLISKKGEIFIGRGSSDYSSTGIKTRNLKLFRVNKDVLEINYDDKENEVSLQKLEVIDKEHYLKASKKQKELDIIKKEESIRVASIAAQDKENETSVWYESGGFENNVIKIKGKELFVKSSIDKSKNRFSAKLDKPLDQYYNYDEITSNYSGIITIRYIEFIGQIIDKGCTKFETMVYEGDEVNKIKISIEDRNSKINGTKVSKGKIMTILRTLPASSLTKEKIKEINKLGKTRLLFLQVDRLTVSEITVPISSDVIDQDLFSLEINKYKTNVEWSILKDIFSITTGETHNNISYGRFLKLMVYMGSNKKEVLDMLKEYKILQDL